MDAALNWVWQGGFVGAAAAVVLVALRRAGANVRYTVCWAAALLILALPIVPGVVAGVVSSIPSGTPPVGAWLPVRRDPVVSLPDSWWTSAIVMLAAWLVWVGVHAVRLVSAAVAIRRARARSHAFPVHLDAALPHWRRLRGEGRRATLVLSNAVASAAVLGWGPPTIAVAPWIVRTLDPDDLDRVLVHEWVHVQRHDDIASLIQIAIRILAGWHPALWWIDRRLHLEREMACDAKTVAMTGSAKSYAECLVKISARRETLRAMETAPAVFSRSGVRARVIEVVSRRPSARPIWSGTLAGIVILALSLATAAVARLPVVDAAGFVQPAMSVRALTSGVPFERPIPVTLPTRSEVEDGRSPRRRQVLSREPGNHAATAQEPSRASDAQTPVQHLPIPDTQVEPIAAMSLSIRQVPTAPHAPAMAVTGADTSPMQTEERASARPVQPDVVATDASRSPWDAAAAGGVAIGRTSRDVGVATAGFFTRFARRVAGSS